VEPGFLFAASRAQARTARASCRWRWRRAPLRVLCAFEAEPRGARAVRRAPSSCVPRPRVLCPDGRRFFGAQPETIVAVTGTSGKTSVAHFVRQIFQRPAIPAASLGTLGTVTAGRTLYGGLTTPDPVALHKDLRGWPLKRSPMRLSKRRATASTSTGSTACGSTAAGFHQSWPGSHGLPPDGRGLSGRQTAAVPGSSAGMAEPWSLIRVKIRRPGLGSRRRRGLPVISVGERGKDLKLTGTRRVFRARC
jgi:UDP-N-acetylmuramoyl-L-alanyl-D-glutamate--2,6-diaminopimelate ligase